jgi:hypothetical protein
MRLDGCPLKNKALADIWFVFDVFSSSPMCDMLCDPKSREQGNLVVLSEDHWRAKK